MIQQVNLTKLRG